MQPRRRQNNPLVSPYFWSTQGVPVQLVDVTFSQEAVALNRYFIRSMPPGTELLRIQRVENRNVWQKYKLHRVQAQNEFSATECDPTQVELWLWHGSDAFEEEDLLDAWRA